VQQLLNENTRVFPEYVVTLLAPKAGFGTKVVESAVIKYLVLPLEVVSPLRTVTLHGLPLQSVKFWVIGEDVLLVNL
jgi:hypothetical protein